MLPATCRTAAKLLPWLIFGLGSGLVAAQQASGNLADAPPPLPQDLTCDDVETLGPGQDRCAFVRSKCQEDGLIAYLAIYYCHVQPHGAFLTWVMVAACASLLVLLFRLMSHTADDFFSCILSQISQDLGLPPRLAGVTLLALGNGAPDISSVIAAVKMGQSEMALGALTGAGMFVGCVIAGRIIVLNGGAKCRGAQVRDVLFFFIAVAVVLGFVASGRLSYSGVITLLSLYGSYVMVVAVADFTKRMGVEWAELAARLHRCVASSVRRRLRQPLLDESDGEVGGEELQEGGGSRPSYLSSRPGSGVDGVAPSVWLVNGRRQPRHYRQQQRLQQQQLAEQQRQQQLQQQAEQLSDVSDTDEPAPRPSLGQPPRRALRKGSPRSDESRMSAMEIASSAADSPVVEVRRAVVQFAEEATFIPNRDGAVAVPRYEELVHMSTQEYRRRALADMAASKSFYHMASEEEEEYWSEEEDVEEGSAAPPGYTPPTITANGATPGAATAQAASAADAAAAAAVRAATTVAAAPPGRSGRPGWQQALAAVDRPFLLLLQATVPLVEASSYRRWWFLLSMGCSPVFICCFYLGLLGWLPLLVAAAVGGTLAGLAALGTAGLEGQAPEWGLGTGYPIGAALVAVYGFCLAAMWIDTFASEIVGILRFFGVLFALDQTILGVTVLAWGNSLMDYMNNVTIAGKSAGGISMAMTACFAGPLFNMLIGLGLGFLFLLRDTGQAAVLVALDPSIAVGCAFIMASCLAIVAASLHGHQWLSTHVGWAMIAWYGLYLAVVLLVLAI